MIQYTVYITYVTTPPYYVWGKSVVNVTFPRFGRHFSTDTDWVTWTEVSDVRIGSTRRRFPWYYSKNECCIKSFRLQSINQINVSEKSIYLWQRNFFNQFGKTFWKFRSIDQRSERCVYLRNKIQQLPIVSNVRSNKSVLLESNRSLSEDDCC